MSASTTSASSTLWATMAKGNNACVNKCGNNAVRVTLSDCPVVDNWSLPQGATPTIVSTGISSDTTSTSDDSDTPTTPGSKQKQVTIGTAMIGRRGRAQSIIIGNRTGINTQHCRYCEKNGHLEHQCPAKAADQAAERNARHEAFLERQARRDHAVCFHCGEAGHIKTECLNPSKKQQAEAALAARIEMAMAEGLSYEEAHAGETALASYEARAEDGARRARAQKTRAQRKNTEIVIGADQGSYELNNGGIVGALKGYKA